MNDHKQNLYWSNDLGQSSSMLNIRTSGPGFIEITRNVENYLDNLGVKEGLLTVFVCHTSASLVIQENADPDVKHDLSVSLSELAPRDYPYRHNCEGPDDMPAHIKSMLTSTSLSVPVQNSRMVLGTWQGIYLVEHRDHPHHRKVALHFIGTR